MNNPSAQHPQKRSQKKGKLQQFCLFWAVNASRLLLAATFIFSGFVKAVDPMGMFHKLNAYFTHWGMTFPEDSLLLKVMVVAIATVELVLGICWLLGSRPRFTTWCTTFLLAGMTLLTAYIYLYNPVPDCGCFGEALTLSHQATLVKNIVLWMLCVWAQCHRRYMQRLITQRNEWITSMYTWIYAIVLCVYSYRYLPALDFTDYRIGTNWRAAWNLKPGPNDPDVLTTLCFTDAQTGDIANDELLADGYTFLLTLPDPDVADPDYADLINDLYDDCVDSNYRFYAVAGEPCDPGSVERWIDRTGAAYPILNAEAVQLKAMVRSNPGLLLLKDGVLIHKWSVHNLPVISTDNSWKEAQGDANGTGKLLLWYLLPLITIILTDRIWVGNKFRKRYIFHKRLTNQIKMRKKIVAGNWKMNKNLQEGVALAKELNTMLVADKPACDVVICTPFIHLASVAAELDANVIGLGAENCADKVSGAYTGEVSAEMVKSTGANYVILGHSERRAYYHETAEILKEKVNLALANGLKVIFCIGEVLEERESGKQNEVVKAQLEGSLFELTQEEFANVILAYEPVWAIGTGKTATAEQAQDMHAFIRNVIAEKFGAEAAENVSILYGGSCKPSNAKEIFAKPDVDGGLIGGAALKAADFKGIIDAWK